MRDAPGSTPGLHLLAFDTAGPHGSVALGLGSQVVSTTVLDREREHASRLLPAIERTLADAGLDRSDLGGVVVGEGPGSFTGVRIAAATAKGLVHALEVPLWAVSSLAATAMASEVGPLRYVLFDARGDRVYGACYAIESAGYREVVAPHAGTVVEVVEARSPAGAVFVGDGAARHGAALEAAGFEVAVVEGSPSAVGLLACVRARPDAARVGDAGRWEPRYVRPSSAERPWTP